MRSKALVLAAVLTLSACGGAGETPATGGGGSGDPAPGVTDDTVLIGTHQPLTGPAAPGYSTISAGAKAMYSHINDNGGIHGRKIEYRVEDDGYNPTRTVEVVKKLVLQDEVFAIVGGLGTPTHSKVVDFLNTEGVPDLLVASGALMWDDPAKSRMTFGFQVDYTREGKILGDYIAKTFPDAKVGVFHQNDDVGRDGMAGLEKHVTITSAQGYDPANTDVLPQITALKQAGADVVVCECVPAFTALAILTSARIGYKPKFVVSSIGADPRTLTGLLSEFGKRAGAEVSAPQLLTGLIGAGYLPDVNLTSDPWTALFREVHQKYIPDVPLTNTVVYGMAQAYTFAQALKEAGRDLTREGIIKVMESGVLTGPGLTPFAFSPESHSGYTGAYVFTINADGNTTVVQEPVVTDRGDGPIEPAPTGRKTPSDIGLVG
ncbi:ABC transporter substrate-binding protein [Actinokineospora fastidiosa]|uniref:ABC transporter substrate-binding protein n=1 Tax=Actinokineospora fastidiosa TaxID=1816 RepID=A0A918LCI2_9PSEU|nr:ABC transporter substrate-binding protein [Actinokineospora fastidiosa]GGS31487.1 ABC transporter substrate-binding protein [Actinokineospora fastidiosa]